MVTHDHDAVLQGLELNGEGIRPTILERTDQRFLPAVLNELKAGDQLAELARTVAQRRDESGVLKLFQPVHRTFHLVLVEASCDRFGRPRLDPASIESAGCVVRRVETDDQGQPLHPGRLAGWRRSGDQIRGWARFAGEMHGGRPLAESTDLDVDPDPSRRPPALSAGNAEIDRRLAETPFALLPDPQKLGEHVTPLFVAPPEVCRAAGRTVLYGVVPVTSNEHSEFPAPPPQFDLEQVENLLSILLHSEHEKTPPMQNFGWLDRTLHAATWTSIEGSQVLRTALEQAMIMLDAFGASAASRELFALLEEIKLDYGDVQRGAGTVLQAAADVLIHRRTVDDALLSPLPDQIRMPRRWPAINADLRKRMVGQAAAILQERMASITPDEGRYARPDAQYRLRAFVRVKRPAPCPPRLVWSEFSEPFTIAPWHETNDRARPTQIDVPDPFAPGFLDRLKPNVSFNMPDSMLDLLDNLGLPDLLDGKKPKAGGGGFGLGWICGLNITIVFLVALIVMFIFLILLNIVFSWLPYVRICIPFPKKEE